MTAQDYAEICKGEPSEKNWLNLFQSWNPILRRWVIRHLGLRGDLVDELVQEHWETVLKNWNQWEPGSWAGWSTTLTRNLFLNNRNRASNRLITVSSTTENIELIDECYTESVFWTRYENWVSGLPESDKVLWKHRTLGENYESLSERTGKPVSWVRNRLHYLRNGIKKTDLQECWKYENV